MIDVECEFMAQEVMPKLCDAIYHAEGLTLSCWVVFSVAEDSNPIPPRRQTPTLPFVLTYLKCSKYRFSIRTSID